MSKDRRSRSQAMRGFFSQPTRAIACPQPRCRSCRLIYLAPAPTFRRECALQRLFAGAGNRNHELAVLFGNEAGAGAARTSVGILLLNFDDQFPGWLECHT